MTWPEVLRGSTETPRLERLHGLRSGDAVALEAGRLLEGQHRLLGGVAVGAVGASSSRSRAGSAASAAPATAGPCRRIAARHAAAWSVTGCDGGRRCCRRLGGARRSAWSPARSRGSRRGRRWTRPAELPRRRYRTPPDPHALTPRASATAAAVTASERTRPGSHRHAPSAARGRDRSACALRPVPIRRQSCSTYRRVCSKANAPTGERQPRVSDRTQRAARWPCSSSCGRRRGTASRDIRRASSDCPASAARRRR